MYAHGRALRILGSCLQPPPARTAQLGGVVLSQSLQAPSCNLYRLFVIPFSNSIKFLLYSFCNSFENL